MQIVDGPLRGIGQLTLGLAFMVRSLIRALLDDRGRGAVRGRTPGAGFEPKQNNDALTSKCCFNRRARPLADFSGGRIWGSHGEPLRSRRRRSSASPLNAMRPHTGGRIELCRTGPSIIKSTMRRPAAGLVTGRYCFRKFTLWDVSR